MKFSGAVVFAACLAGASAATSPDSTQPKGLLGFNSGATTDGTTPKVQADFEKEFSAGQNLQGTPGKFNAIRLYTNIQMGTDSDPIEAFPAAIKTNSSLLLGLWCSGTDNIDNELKALKTAISGDQGKQLANLVVGISVGSEDLYRISPVGMQNDPEGKGQGPDTIVGFIKQVRDAIKGTPLEDKPVGHTDTWDAWGNSSNSGVVDEADFIGTNIFPYYEKQSVNPIGNASYLFDHGFNVTTKAAGDKPVWVTETGWPTAGPKFGQADASVDNARTFWDQVGCRLFGRQNVFWYTLEDAAGGDNNAQFAVTDRNFDGKPTFNLTCQKDSGAPQAASGTGTPGIATPTGSAPAATSSNAALSIVKGLNPTTSVVSLLGFLAFLGMI